MLNDLSFGTSDYSTIVIKILNSTETRGGNGIKWFIMVSTRLFFPNVSLLIPLKTGLIACLDNPLSFSYSQNIKAISNWDSEFEHNEPCKPSLKIRQVTTGRKYVIREYVAQL